MRNLKALTAREARHIVDLINEQYDCKLKMDFYFLLHEKENSVFVLSRDVATVDLESLRINSLGSYFCELNSDNTQVRLSIEGSQVVGPIAKKNKITLSDEMFKEWIKGLPLKIDEELKQKLSKVDSYVIIQNEKGDYFGVGRAKNDELLNFTPKNRRIAIDA